ncbi:hypothetical protein V6N13_133891 [Hibiscus sabdariffa]|uniref:RRM domain-containing protein n=1 Tax=Hibiscus sabdariffa TaxID=183260 RepID=A0ABR2R0C2_9ROSI
MPLDLPQVTSQYNFNTSVKMKEPSKCFSVFVGNLSTKVNWRYLKKLFQRYGRVLDVFIPKKTDLSGSKFGFVRSPSMREAETTLFMFEGAWIVDRCIQVNLAKFGSRSKYWRKKQYKDVAHDAVNQNCRAYGNNLVNRTFEEGGCSLETHV